MSNVPSTEEIVEMELYDGNGGGNSSNEGTFGASNTNGPGSVKKLREILRRQKQDSDDEESSDVDFNYEDEDSLSSELAELYSYTEATDSKDKSDRRRQQFERQISAGQIRLRSGSAGHRPLKNEEPDMDEEHEPIEVGHPYFWLEFIHIYIIIHIL